MADRAKTDREKLIELIYEGKMKRIDICANNEDCSLCERDADGEYCCDAVVADHLIANGVVVQEKGEWRKSDFIPGMLTCTNCGIQRNPKFKLGGGAWNLCPNCGADMRKEKPEA